MNPTALPPCVLLVEDDASITRFVSMALDILPIRLLTCTSVAAAVTLLQEHDVKLVITDLMLPGESGLSLVQRLHTDPQLRRNTLIAVFSAGLTPAVKEQLQGLSLWRTLSKPIAVQELESCVTDALALQSPQAVAQPSPPPPAATHSPAEALAITTHFGGDTKLFTTYRSACLRQFSADVQTGDRAATSEDWAALRRLAHSLATVLLTIGRPEDSLVARALEGAAEQNLRSECQSGWADLRVRLQHGAT
ncbi:response regulator [Acidovorax sp. DW039]|uniref:response regulator n=1 Tax=Acidovorax sp. DW039 TaxID=3095606 RepID=UPI0030930CA2|nr:response regulator [Acidovorax sp. DW039]